MIGLTHAVARKQCAFVLLLVLFCFGGFYPVKAGQLEAGLPFATNVRELINAITPQSGRICAYDLEGTILASADDSKILFFQDNSGTTVLEVDLNGKKLKPGQKVRLSGTNFVSFTDQGVSLGTRPLVDADNLHSVVQRSGEVYLKAGLHSIQVNWFNQTAEYSLDAAYAGTHLAKQNIPASVLFRSANGKLLSGLSCRCFEGNWERLPDFDSLAPQKIGTVSNFDISIKPRNDYVGLEFKGFLKVLEDGNYRFFLSSDDGSQLFLDNMPLAASIVGTAPIPAPKLITISLPLFGGQAGLWAEVEGTITFISHDQNYLKFELTSGENRMQVDILDSSDGVPWYLLNSRVRVRGICPEVKNTAGQKYAGKIVAANWRAVHVVGVAPDQWAVVKHVTVGELRNETPEGSNGIACLLGRLHSNPATQTVQFEDATGSLPVELLTEFPGGTNSIVECLCQWNRAGTNVFLDEAVVRNSAKERGGETNTLPVLTTAIQVQTLTREQAAREYPVKIQGVVTEVSEDYKSLLVQDSTRGVFVWMGEDFLGDIPQVGDYCKIEGVSQPADFSPIVVLRQATVLWRGQLPQPVIPNHDQLSNGSLDAQYVEIRGLVIGISEGYVTLLTAEGTFNFDISPAPRAQWKSFLNSIIRVRGCLKANWDVNTHSVILDQPIHLVAASVSMDSPPPTDLFNAKQERASDLLQFNARFDPLKRVKVCGQIIHCNPDMDYVMDGQTGVRFQLAEPLQFDPGDEVEVVGLVELGGASSVLRHAVARKTGHQHVPVPRKLTINSISNNYDSTFVSLPGTLVDYQNHRGEQVLEMQVGVKRFVARLNMGKRNFSQWQVGSRLRLTGVLHVLDGNQLMDHEVRSFELLLNSPDDVQVLAQPPWWTLGRLLAVAAFLLTGLVLAFIWITLLRRQVDRRTQQLRHEILARERTEKIRAVEEERARIARDLHDDLGSTLTEISMMATMSPVLKIEPKAATGRLRKIAEISRSMISALDGVVWVVNSKNDTLSSLMEYLASNAEEFLATARVACRIELPKGYPERIVEAEIRHDVMLAVREAINNAVRHGQPNEVLLRLSIIGENLEIWIQDDGCGFNPASIKGNGLENLHDRMKKLNGSCQVESMPGEGTTVMLKLTLRDQALT